MQHHLLAFILAGATVTLAAQADPQNSSSPPAKRDADKEMTMLGCVTRDATSNQQFTFTDSIDGTKYHMSGRSVNKFLGQPVQVVGIIDTRRLKVVGGLTPSPNIAAQAGAIDPGKAHVAAIDGATRGTGTGEALPTFKVTRVSAAPGECRK
jgi:hypothetical protein